MDLIWDCNVGLNSPYALYPHDLRSLLAIVPNIQRSQSPVLKILKSSFTTIWFLTILLFTVFRVILEHVAHKPRNERSIGQHTFQTFALLIGAGNNRSVQRLYERMLVWFISMIGLLEGNLLIGQLFSDYSAQSNDSMINTIAELQQSSFSVQIPDDRRYLRDIFR